MRKWLITKLGTLKTKWKSDVNTQAIENLVELASGGVAVTTERNGIRYRTILQIDGDVIQKCDIPSGVEGEYIDSVWLEHLARVNANLQGVREVVDRLIGKLVYIVSVALTLLGMGTAFGLVSDGLAEVTVESAIWSIVGGVPGLLFLRLGKRVTAIVFRRLLSRRLKAVSARMTGQSLAAQ